MNSPLEWLRDQVEGWEQSALGIFRLRTGQERWPVQASGPDELKEQLVQRGHLLPLPTEPAALANLIEIELREHLFAAVEGKPGVEVRLGTERSYPDLELSGTEHVFAHISCLLGGRRIQRKAVRGCLR